MRAQRRQYAIQTPSALRCKSEEIRFSVWNLIRCLILVKITDNRTTQKLINHGIYCQAIATKCLDPDSASPDPCSSVSIRGCNPVRCLRGRQSARLRVLERSGWLNFCASCFNVCHQALSRTTSRGLITTLAAEGAPFLMTSIIALILSPRP